MAEARAAEAGAADARAEAAEAGAEAGVEQQLLPLLDHLARVGRRAAEASMPPAAFGPGTSSR